MEISLNKSCFITHSGVIDSHITDLFPITKVELPAGFTYLIFFLKQNGYGIKDWQWLFDRVEKKLGLWCYRCLSLGG